MRFVGTDIDRIEWGYLMAMVADAYNSPPGHRNYHVRVMMMFEACEAARLKFEVAHVKPNLLAHFADQYLT